MKKMIAEKSHYYFIILVSPPFSDTVWICKWNDMITENCTSFFSQIITDEGVCYTFNMLDKSDLFRGDPVPYYESNQNPSTGWSLDGGYKPDAPLDAYPYRALAAGTRGGLFVVMRADLGNADFYCRGPVQGFRVLLHNPAEFPLVGERYFRTPDNHEVTAVVQPNIITTTESFKSYAPAWRQCYLQSERYLQFFKIYTQRNCEFECLTNYTLKRCGCVSLHMPRSPGTKICGPGRKLCTIEAKREQVYNEIQASFLGQPADMCDCLPACTNLQYNAETSQANYDIRAILEAFGENSTEHGMFSSSRLSIFFNEMQFATSIRSEVFDIVDFLASCGGLLGLFCGVSLLSIVELGYYITLRFWGNVKKSKKEKNNKDEKSDQCQQKDSAFIINIP